MILKPEMVLYHGSYCEVRSPQIEKCRPGKDFGKGFYLTTSRTQAIRFTKTAVKKAVSDGYISKSTQYGYLNEYRFKSSLSKELQIFEFRDTDREWLRCVVGHRKRNSSLNIRKWDKYDIIAGKIANDNTNLVITIYMDGLYGEIGSERADAIAIQFLEPDNLKDQLCFRTEKAIETLEFLKSERIRL